MLDGECRVFANFKVKVASVSAKGRGVNGREVDGAFVLDGEGLEGVGEGGALFGSFGEDIGEGDTGLGLEISFWF